VKLLITGADGYIGSELSCCLEELGKYSLIKLSRTPSLLKNLILSPELSTNGDWERVLADVSVIVHLAGRAHMLNDNVLNPLTEFRRVNMEGTLNLAKQAIKQGVKRFVFISSLGVNGNNNKQPFIELDTPNPQEPYAISKLEAERGLLALAKESSLEVVIIRPPLVYGSNAPGNFGSLVKWANKRIPLPFGAIRNQRSFIALDNLVSFIIHCIDHPKAANEVFLISDGEDVSTTQLLKKVTKSFGKRAFLLPIPVSWMTFSAKMIGKADVANRLFGSLQVDSSKARDLLGWKPVVTMDEQLKKIADAAK
jgi:nucleoside-diphosphate-sugar epimerase